MWKKRVNLLICLAVWIASFATLFGTGATASLTTTVTIYYKSGLSNPHIHYRMIGTSNWTTAPGLPMVPAEVTGFFKFSLNVGSSSGLEACFNNGKGVWDSNGGKNYLFAKGVSTFFPGTNGAPGRITAGAPNADTQPPIAPSALIVLSKTANTVTLRWLQSTDNVAVDRYEILRNNTSVGFTANTAYTDSSLVASTEYTYAVRAIDSSGNRSPQSPSTTVTTNEAINNQVTIYYKAPTGWSQAFAHFRPQGGNWTTAPGSKMSAAEVVGFYKIVLPIGERTQVETVFNNGAALWDNNNTQNYKFGLGASTLENGIIRAGKPTTDSDNFVTIYYRQGFSKPYVHYRVAGGTWTTAPGLAMKPSAFVGYSEVTLPLGTARQLEAAFNDGGTNWDNNVGHDYFFEKGVYTLDKGMIKVGKPDALEPPINGTLMQYFEWDLPPDGKHWNRMNDDAQNLSDMGVTALWLPPVYKGAGGAFDVGYGVYDRWDLGEFNQAGSVRTKYGTKEELKRAIATVQGKGIQVYGDIVMNHNIGLPGDTQTVRAVEINPNSRNQATTDWYDISTYTKFDYPARNNKYSSFKWNASHFKGAEINVNNGKKAIYRWRNWDADADTSEKGNYDFLLGTDIDVKHPDVANELKNWGVWLTNELNLDGYRLDAVKHISASFIKDWVDTMRSRTGRNLFAFGEYASGNPAVLEYYMNQVGWNQSMYDFKLKGNLSDSIKANGFYDMRQLRNETFSAKHPTYTVTYVNIHDTQPGQFDDSYIPWWKQQVAYAYTLTREQGYPLLFYGDYYGIPKVGVPAMRDKLDPLLKARQYYVYGKQRDYFDHPDIVGWTREGSITHVNSGLATLISDGVGGSKWMEVGKQHAGEIWYDLTGNRAEEVKVNAEGWAEFKVNPGSTSVYVFLRK